MARGRGILLSGSHILTLAGERVSTFYGCDEEFLALDGIVPGDFVTFGAVMGSSGHAERIKKATPTDKERAKHAAIFTAAANEIAGEKARLAALDKAAKAKAVKKPATSESSVVEPTFRTLEKLGFLPKTATLAATTKTLIDEHDELPRGDELVALILEAADSPRFVRYTTREDSSFAARLNALLAGTPIRIAQVAASLKKGHEIEIRTNNGSLVERAWFDSAAAIVLRVSALLVERNSPRRLFAVHEDELSTAMIIASPDEAEALEST